MRFEKLSTEGFGCLKDWESPNIKKDIVVVYGRNESGKSTLFQMVKTLLYGWSPATASTHPYVPWDESQASCSCYIIVGDEKIHIGRRLRSRASGVMKKGDEQIRIANRSVSMVEHLPKGIYKEVYALTSDELNLPSEALWEKLKEQLLAGQYYSFIKPSSEVTEELEKEANSLWRPDRRGKPRMKALKQELIKLRKKLREAKENDKKLYELETRISEKQNKLDILRREKIELVAYIDWCDSILPIHNKEKQMQSLLKDAGDEAPFEDIPSDVEDSLSGIEKDINKLQNKIQHEKDRLKELKDIISTPTKRDDKIYRSQKEIGELIKSYERIAENLDKKRELQREQDRVKALLERDGDELIIGGWKDVYTDSILIIDEAMLRRKVASYSRVKSSLEEKRAELSALSIEDFSKLRVAKLIPSGALFTALGILALFLPDSLFKFGGLLALAIGIICLLFGWVTKDSERERKGLENTKRGECENLSKSLQKLQNEIHGCLQGIPFASIDEAYMGENIIMDVNRFKRTLERLVELETEYDYIKTDIDTKVNIVDRIMKISMLDRGRDILEDIDRLANMLSTAKDRIYRAKKAKLSIKDCEGTIDGLKSELEDLEMRKKDIISKLEKFDGDDLATQIEDLRRRRSCYLEAKLLEEQILKEKQNLPDSCFADYNQWYIKNKNKDILDLEKKAEAKVRLDEIDVKINDLNAKIGSLSTKLEHGKGIETAHQIQGQIVAVEKELEEVARKRDKLILLKNIIDKSDREFKEDHQPDVLKRASKYLSIITGDKYIRLLVPEDIDKKVSIIQSDDPYPIEVGESISRGTQEQIYLALRLALMDHLDIQYQMPTFLDEVFINWDGMRIRNSLELIKKISTERQVFIFTCHTWLVDLLSNNLDVQVLAMD